MKRLTLVISTYLDGKLVCVHVHVHVFKKLHTKLDPKSKEHIMLGYCEDGTCYQLYDLETKKIIRARSVVFFEDIPETYKATTTKQSTMLQMSKKKM